MNSRFEVPLSLLDRVFFVGPRFNTLSMVNDPLPVGAIISYVTFICLSYSVNTRFHTLNKTFTFIRPRCIC